MDLNHLKQAVDTMNKKDKEMENKIEVYNQAYNDYLTNFPFDELQKLYRNFLDSIGDIKDEILQELIEKALTEHEDVQYQKEVNLKFELLSPDMSLSYDQGETDNGFDWDDEYEKDPDKNKYDGINDYIISCKSINKLCYQIVIQFSVCGAFALWNTYSKKLIESDEFDYLWQDDLTYFTSDKYIHVCPRDHSNYAIMCKALQYALNWFNTNNIIEIDGFNEVNKKFEGEYIKNTEQFINPLILAIIERLENFGLTVPDYDKCKCDPDPVTKELVITIPIKNPLLQGD